VLLLPLLLLGHFQAHLGEVCSYRAQQHMHASYQDLQSHVKQKQQAANYTGGLLASLPECCCAAAAST
jgi:hypothetical protein